MAAAAGACIATAPPCIVPRVLSIHDEKRSVAVGFELASPGFPHPLAARQRGAVE
jgi:hypothetical protein